MMDIMMMDIMMMDLITTRNRPILGLTGLTAAPVIIILMKFLSFLITSTWLLFGVLAAASGAVYAEEAGQKARQRAEPIARTPAESDPYEKLLREADALVKSGKPDQAYILLKPLEFEHSGEVRFDYLIGTAALDSGKPDMATLAFERVLAVNPDLAAARLDMARAYYQLGDMQRARTEFSAAFKQNPSEAARVSIQKYLDAIDALKAGRRLSASGYMEGSFGRDSNVNSSTSQSQVLYFDSTIAIPAWATAPLDPSNVKVKDNYYVLAAGGEIDYKLFGNWGLYAGGDLRKRGNNTQKQFDSLGLDARAGIMFETQANRLRIGAMKGQFDLGGLHNSDTTGVKGDWRHLFSPSNQLNVFAQSSQYRFIDPFMQPNDIDLRAMGLGWRHVLADGQSSLSGSVHYGTEKDVAPVITVFVSPFGNITPNPSGGRNDGAKRFKGLRVGGQSAINEKTTLFASTGMQIGDYSKINYLFLVQRKDILRDSKLGADWHLNRLWTLRPQLSYSRNDSNIAIYGYERTDVSLTVRRDFR